MFMFLVIYLISVIAYIVIYYQYCKRSYKNDYPDEKEVELRYLYNGENPFFINFIGLIPIVNIAIAFMLIVVYIFEKYRSFKIKL